MTTALPPAETGAWRKPRGTDPSQTERPSPPRITVQAQEQGPTVPYVSVTAETTGHLFILNGLIESLLTDAVIVPTDTCFAVETHWMSSGLVDDPVLARPSNWPQPFAQSRTSESTWFISVADDSFLDISELANRVHELIGEIMRNGDFANGRPPRIALPVLGIGGGGLGEQRGVVLGTLLEVLSSAAIENSADILLVTPSCAVFSAAQHVRRHLQSTGRRQWDLSDADADEAKRLGRLAADSHLALFLGAGVSMAAGLPSWNDLLDVLAEEAGRLPPDYGRLGPLDQAQFLATELGAKKMSDLVCAEVGQTTTISLAHALLAGMSCQQAITTNYDGLYERAVSVVDGTPPAVLPWNQPEPQQQWLLKIHGDVDRPDSIVLTRRDFVLFDAHSRPAGSLLQAMLLTKHLLIVGASLADDNVIRLAMETDDYLERNSVKRERTQGTFIDVDGVQARQGLWREQFRWFVCGGASPTERVRQMEIFLDAVAAYAAADASWLIDERFAGLLDERGQEIAARARTLASDASRSSGLLEPLAAALRRLRDTPRDF